MLCLCIFLKIFVRCIRFKKCLSHKKKKKKKKVRENENENEKNNFIFSFFNKIRNQLFIFVFLFSDFVKRKKKKTILESFLKTALSLIDYSTLSLCH